MCRSSNPTSDGSVAGPGIRVCQTAFSAASFICIWHRGLPPCAFFATGTQVRLLLRNYVTHNRYTLFCVWARLSASPCDMAFPCDCFWGTPASHITKEFCALVTSARPSLERTENWPLA